MRYRFSLDEARQLSVRERRNWVIRAYERATSRKAEVDG